MDIKSLRCFVAVAEKLNFSRAAESLYMSQPALSLRINSLEEELGVKLFRRNRQKVFLTAAGAAILPEIQELLARLDALPHLAGAGSLIGDPDTGFIHVALDSTLPETMLDDLTQRFYDFYRKYPKIDVELSSVDYRQFESALLGRKVDLCFMGLKHSEYDHLNPALNSILFRREKMVLAYTGAADASLPALVRDRELLQLVGEDRWNLVLLNYLEGEKIPFHPRIVSSGFALCASLMKESTVTFMPISFFESLTSPNLNYREMDIPDSEVLSCFVWDHMNFNPALQLLMNQFHQESI